MLDDEVISDVGEAEELARQAQRLHPGYALDVDGMTTSLRDKAKYSENPTTQANYETSTRTRCDYGVWIPAFLGRIGVCSSQGTVDVP